MLNNPPTDVEERGKPDQVHEADAIRAQLLTVTIETNRSSTKIKQHVRQVKEKIFLPTTKFMVGLTSTG